MVSVIRSFGPKQIIDLTEESDDEINVVVDAESSDDDYDVRLLQGDHEDEIPQLIPPPPPLPPIVPPFVVDSNQWPPLSNSNIPSPLLFARRTVEIQYNRDENGRLTPTSLLKMTIAQMDQDEEQV